LNQNNATKNLEDHNIYIFIIMSKYIIQNELKVFRNNCIEK